MKPQNELIYSDWGADEVDTNKRAVEVLQTINKFFPKVTYWTARHEYDRGLQDKFEVESDFNENPSLIKGFVAVDLWRQTVEHFNSLGLDSKFINIQYGFWSDELEGAYASLSDYSFGFENWDSEIEEERTLPQSDVFAQLMKQIGLSPTIGGVWMLNHSAFAGDPVYLYEPKKPFNDYYSIEGHEPAIEPIRAIRRAVRAAFTTNEIVARLRDLGAEVELLAENRLFAKFGALGGDGGKRILSQLERHITARLE